MKLMDVSVNIVMQRKVHVLIYKGEYEKDGANGGKIKIEKFYEIYNGCRIATIVGENLVYLTELSYFKVNGRLFITSTSLQPLAYNENKIYSIYDAFKENILSLEDVDAFYNDYYSLNGDYNNIQNIERIYNVTKYEEGSSGMLSFFEKVVINYGTYSNTTVMMMGFHSLLEQKTKEKEVTIQNYKFIYYNDYLIIVWDGTAFYSLEEASNRNLLTEQEIKKIYDIHQKEYISLFEN